MRSLPRLPAARVRALAPAGLPLRTFPPRGAARPGSLFLPLFGYSSSLLVSVWPLWGACVRVLFLTVRNFLSTVWAGDRLSPLPNCLPSLLFILFSISLLSLLLPSRPPFFFPDSSFFPLQFHHLSCPLSPCPFPYPCAL